MGSSPLQHLNFDFHTSRKAEVRENFDGVGGAFGDVYESGVSTHFKLFAGVFVDESGFENGEFVDFSW